MASATEAQLGTGGVLVAGSKITVANIDGGACGVTGVYTVTNVATAEIHVKQAVNANGNADDCLVTYTQGPTSG